MSEDRSGTISVNGRTVPWQAPDVATLLACLGYAAETRGIAVAVNGAVVPRSEWSTRPVEHGDVIEIVGAVQGG